MRCLVNSAQIQILLVEDNPVDGCVIEAYLRERQGLPKIEVERVARLSEAVQRLRARSFDAVLLDLNLPDSAGLETFLKMQAEASHLPIVVLTGVDDEVWLWKPFNGVRRITLSKGKLTGACWSAPFVMRSSENRPNKCWQNGRPN